MTLPIIITISIGAALTFAGLIFVIFNISSVFNDNGGNFLGGGFIKKHIAGMAMIGSGGLLMIISVIIAAIKSL